MKKESFKKYLFKDYSTLMFLSINVLLIVLPFYLLIFTDVHKDSSFKTFIVLFMIPFSIIYLFLTGKKYYYLEINEIEILQKNLIYFWFEKKIQREEIISIENNFSVENGEFSDYNLLALYIKTNNENHKITFEHDVNFFLDVHRTLERFNYNSNIFEEYSLPFKITTISNNFEHLKYRKNTTEEKTLELSDSFFLYFGIILIGTFIFISPSLGVNIFFIFCILPVIMILYHFWNMKFINFNRKKGVVTLTSRFNKKNTIVHFNDLKFHVFFIPDIEEKLNKLIIEIPNNKEIITLYSGKDSKSFFSYIVWFMDKNRPLPYGNYDSSDRKKDYERRKKDGFLPYLYPSEIEMNEENK